MSCPSSNGLRLVRREIVAVTRLLGGELLRRIRRAQTVLQAEPMGLLKQIAGRLRRIGVLERGARTRAPPLQDSIPWHSAPF